MKSRARLHFLDAFQKIKNQHSELRFEGSIVCAVSGGVDSVCMLALANELATSLNIVPVVAHLNHAVRETADRDEEFVRRLAASFGLRFYSEKLPRPPTNRNLEAWMREERYGFLNRVRSDVGAALILTAHHAADQEETLLMHLLTNRLPKGEVLGIRFLDLSRRVFRPLLHCKKEELLEYAAANKLEWVEDESNSDEALLRNRVRRSILPFLREQLNPGLDQALTALSARIGSDEEFISANLPKLAEYLVEVERSMSEVSGVDSGVAVGLKLRKLIDLPLAIRWRILRDYIQYVSADAAERVSFTKLFAVAEALSEYPDKLVVFELGGGVRLELERGGVLRFTSQLD